MFLTGKDFVLGEKLKRFSSAFVPIGVSNTLPFLLYRVVGGLFVCSMKCSFYCRVYPIKIWMFIIMEITSFCVELQILNTGNSLKLIRRVWEYRIQCLQYKITTTGNSAVWFHCLGLFLHSKSLHFLAFFSFFPFFFFLLFSFSLRRAVGLREQTTEPFSWPRKENKKGMGAAQVRRHRVKCAKHNYKRVWQWNRSWYLSRLVSTIPIYW